MAPPPLGKIRDPPLSWSHRFHASLNASPYPTRWICYFGRDLFNLIPDHASVIYRIPNIITAGEYLKTYQEMKCADSRMLSLEKYIDLLGERQFGLFQTVIQSDLRLQLWIEETHILLFAMFWNQRPIYYPVPNVKGLCNLPVYQPITDVLLSA